MIILGNKKPSAADQQNNNVAPTPTLSKYSHANRAYARDVMSAILA